MGLIERFKRDILKHRGRAAILGVLSIVMAISTVKAIFEMQPKEAQGALPATAIPMSSDPSASMSGAEAKEHLDQSRILWHTLREVNPNAVNASVAFAFDPSFYPAPPQPVVENPKQAAPEQVKPLPVAPVIDLEAQRVQHIHDLAKSLVVKTTSLGGGPNNQPIAIVNGQLVTIGQEILGFEVTAIRAREVEFIRDGVTDVSKMPDGQ